MNDVNLQIDDHNEHIAQIAPVPRVSVQAFCETQAVAQMIEEANLDRRMGKAHMKVHMGGAAAAIEAFRSAPTPNLIVMETTSDRASLMSSLETLAEFCDPGTKVVVLGHENDIALYRELTSRGVSDYIVAPVAVLGFIGHVSRLYNGSTNEVRLEESSRSLGRKAASALRRSVTTWPGRSRANSRCRRCSPIST